MRERDGGVPRGERWNDSCFDSIQRNRVRRWQDRVLTAEHGEPEWAFT
jgi:hypothetical protein